MKQPRGFQYPLQPVTVKCEWDVNDALGELAHANRRAAEQQQLLDSLHRQFREAREYGARQAAAKAALNLESQRLTFRYLVQIQGGIDAAQQQLDAIAAERAQLARRLAALRSFADGLERHRKDAVHEYARALDAVAIKDSDDLWLQRMNWRKMK